MLTNLARGIKVGRRGGGRELEQEGRNVNVAVIGLGANGRGRRV